MTHTNVWSIGQGKKPSTVINMDIDLDNILKENPRDYHFTITKNMDNSISPGIIIGF